MSDPGGKPWLTLIKRGPVVPVTVSVHPARADELEALGLDAPAVTLPLLVDTGAPHTIIERGAIDPLGLQAEGFNNFTTAAGTIPRCPVYHALLELHVEQGRKVTFSTAISAMVGQFPKGLPYRGLLGRSSLRKVCFFFNGPAGEFRIWKP